jgi:EPS-associated MarR family transcriptional regulator
MNEVEQGMSVYPPDQLENEEVLRIFREIYKSPQMTQRELSSRLGISLGKINFLINALIERGFVKVENFRRPSSKCAYLYHLTPMGMEKKTRTTHLFLQKKMREYEWLAKEIEQLREEVQESGVPSGEQDCTGNGKIAGT